MLPHREGARERGQEVIGVEVNQKTARRGRSRSQFAERMSFDNTKRCFIQRRFASRKALLVSLEQDKLICGFSGRNYCATA